MRLFFVLSLFLMYSEIVFSAEDCILHVKREACSKEVEKESFAKCEGGVAECDEKPVPANSEKDCAKKALKACDNARLNITKSKVITASYGKDKKAVLGGKNFCESDRPDFNKCDKK